MIEFNYNRGEVLTIALVVILFLGIVGLALGNFTMTEIESYGQEQNSIQAFYLAEAGLNYVLSNYEESSFWTQQGTTSEYELIQSQRDEIVQSVYPAGELISVKKEKDANQLTITVQAKYGKQIRSIKARYKISGGIVGFDNPMTAGNSGINIRKEPNIDGNNTDKYIYTTGEITIKQGGTLEHINLAENQSDSLFYEFDLLELRQRANLILNSGQYDNSSVINSNGITYVDGDLEFKKNVSISGSGILVVNGVFEARNNFSVNWDGNSFNNDSFVIIAKDGIYLKKEAYYKGLLYSKGEIDINKAPNFSGSIMAKEGIEIRKDLNFIYDNTFLNSLEAMQIDISDTSTNEIKLDLMGWDES